MLSEIQGESLLMKRIALIALILTAFAAQAGASTTSSGILAKVKAAEKGLKDWQADMVITEANKKNVSDMGEGYGDILKLDKALVYYKSPDMIRYDGYAEGIKVTYVQNGYTKLILATMIRHKENVKNAPGKRFDSLDIGFVSSRLWHDNNVSVISEKNGIANLKFDPKYGDKDKRHDMVWLDVRNLRLIKREKYRGNGQMRTRTVYSSYQKLTVGLPVATSADLYNESGKELGRVKYKNIKVNTGLGDGLFSLSQRN
jgi:outer membrane lipoprotein-sorting protein